jgi:hypothetical protein
MGKCLLTLSSAVHKTRAFTNIPIPTSYIFHILGEPCVIQKLLCVFQHASRILLLTDGLVSDGRNPRALEQAVGTALIGGKVEIALGLLQDMLLRNVMLRPHYFWPLLIAASRSSGGKRLAVSLRYVID